MRKVAICLLGVCPLMAYAADDTSVTAASTTTENDSAARSVTGSLSLTSDYIFRGQSLTDHRPAAQGEVDWVHSSGIYLGAWASNLHIPDTATPLEADWYGGYNYAINSSLSAGLGAMYYSYYQAADTNTVEFPIQLTWNSTKFGLAYSPHWGGGTLGSAWYVSTGWSGKARWNTTLALNAGYSLFASDLGMKNHADFHAGLSRDMLGLTWDLSGYFVNLEQFNGADDPRGVLTVSKAF